MTDTKNTNVGGPFYIGGALGVGNIRGKNRGGLSVPVAAYDIVPAALVANGVSVAQATTGAANATITGSLASGGVATFDVPRTVTIASTSNLSGLTFTLTGTDTYGRTQTQTVTGPNNATVSSLKAFLTVTQVAVSGSTSTNTFTVGSGDAFGLPVEALSRNYVLTAWNGAFVTTGTLVVADTTSPATAATGDTRGTYLVPDASDAVKRLTLWIYQPNTDVSTTLYGVAPA